MQIVTIVSAAGRLYYYEISDVEVVDPSKNNITFNTADGYAVSVNRDNVVCFAVGPARSHGYRVDIEY